MQLIVDIKNELIADKIIKLLNIFKSDGVEIKNQIVLEKENKDEFSDEYIKKNWKKIVMDTHSSNLDDDARLYEAAAKFYHEKYSD